MNPLRRSRDPVPTTILYRLFVAAVTFSALYAFALVVVTVGAIPRSAVVESTPGASKLANWFLLGMHGVPFSFYQAGTQIAYPVGRISGWSASYRLLPPVGLFLAGYWTARRTYIPTELRAAMEGAKLAIIYTPLLFGAGLLANHSSPEPPGVLPAVEQQTMMGGSEAGVFQIGPEYAMVFVAGVVYPVLFAGLGGATAYGLDRYLAATDSGPLHRIDRRFARLDERWPWPPANGEWNAEAGRSVLAGTLVATSQLAVLFTARSILRGIPGATDDGFWQSIAFPLGGYLGVFLLAFAVAGALWWTFVEQDGRLRLERGMVLGGLTGLLVVTVVWGLTFVGNGSIPDGGSTLGAAALGTAMAYLTIGLLMSLMGALSAGLLMAHHRTMTLRP